MFEFIFINFFELVYKVLVFYQYIYFLMTLTFNLKAVPQEQCYCAPLPLFSY
jgi:hypothetical protein